MEKYDIKFEPFPQHPGWMATKDLKEYFDLSKIALDVEPRWVETAMADERRKRVEHLIWKAHKKFTLGTADLVFQGRYEGESFTQNVGPNTSQHVSFERIFLIPAEHPADVAKAFQLGSHAASYLGKDIVEKTYQALRDIYGVARFTPTFLDCAGLHARFLSAIDRHTAEELLECLQSHDCPGVEGWGRDGEERDIVDAFVHDQKIHFWWD